MKMLMASAFLFSILFSVVGHAESTIVISYKKRVLSLYQDGQLATQYRVAVPKPRYAWIGQETSVQDKRTNPDWQAPDEVRKYHPELPAIIRGGDPSNPMGVAAIILSMSETAIHGTTQAMRASIGQNASFGCIRMRNEDVTDLYQRVSIGTRVVMVP